MNLEQVKQSLKKINGSLGLNDSGTIASELTRLADRVNTKSLQFFIKNNGIETTIQSMETLPATAEVAASGCKLLSLVATGGTEQGISALLVKNRGVLAVANAFTSFQHNREIELLCLRVLAATAWRAADAFSGQVGAAVAHVILDKMKLNDKREALTGLRWGVLGGLATANPQVCASVYEAFGVDGAVKALQSPAASDPRCVVGCLGVLSAFVTNPATAEGAIGSGGVGGVVQAMKRCRGDLGALERCYRTFSAVAKMPGNKCLALTSARVTEEVANWIKLFARSKTYKGVCVCYDIFAQILRNCDVNSAAQMLQAGVIETLLDASAALGSGTTSGGTNGSDGSSGNSGIGTPEDTTARCVFVIRAALEKVLDGNRRVPASVVAFFKDRGAKIAVGQLPSAAGIELITCLAEVSEVVPALVKAGAPRALGDIIAQAQAQAPGAERSLEYACLALGRLATESKGGKISDAKIVSAVSAAFRRSLGDESMLRTVCYTMAALLNDAPPEVYRLAVAQGALDVAVAMLLDADKSLSAYLNPCCIIKGCVRIALGLGTTPGTAGSGDAGAPPDYIGRVIKLGGVAAATRILRRALALAIDSGRTIWDNFEARRAQVSVLEVLSLVLESPQHPEAKDIFVKDDGLIMLQAILLNAAAFEMDPGAAAAAAAAASSAGGTGTATAAVAAQKGSKANPKLRDCLWAERISLGILRSIVETKPEYTKSIQHFFFPDDSDVYDDDEDEDGGEGSDGGGSGGCDVRPDLNGKNVIFLILEQSYPEKEFVQQECLAFIMACLQQGAMSVLYPHCNVKTFIDVQKERISNPSIQVLTDRVLLSVLRAVKSDENDDLELASEFLADNGEVNAVVAALTIHAQDVRVHIAGVELLAELFQFDSVKDKYLTPSTLKALVGFLARFPDVEEYQCAVLLLVRQLKNELRFKDERSCCEDALTIVVAALRAFPLNDTLRESSLTIILSFLSTQSTEIFPLVPQDFVDAIVAAMIRSIEVNPYKSPLVTVKAAPGTGEGHSQYLGELVINDAFWKDIKVMSFEESDEEKKMGAKDYARYSEENSREYSAQHKGVESLKAVLYSSLDRENKHNQDALLSGFTKGSNGARVMKLLFYSLVRWQNDGCIVANAFVALKSLLELFPALQEEAVMRYNAMDAILCASWKQKLYRTNPKIHVQAFQLIATFLSPILKSEAQHLSAEAKERVYASLEKGGLVEYAIFVLDTYSEFSSIPVAGEALYVLVTEKPAVFCPLVARCGGIDVILKRMAGRRMSYATKYLVNGVLATFLNDPHICTTHRCPGLRETMTFVRNEPTPNITVQYFELLQSIVAMTVAATPRGLPVAVRGLRLSEAAFYMVLMLSASKLGKKQTEDILDTLNLLLESCGEEAYARICSRRETFDSITAAIRNNRSQYSVLERIFVTIDLLTSYLGYKNVLWRLFQPYIDATGRPCDYKYLSPQFLGSTFQLIFYHLTPTHRAYRTCARLTDIFCSTPYYLAPTKATTSTVSSIDFAEICTKNIDNLIERASCGPNDKTHAISGLFTIAKLSKEPFFSTCVGRNWGIRAAVRSLLRGLESPLCVNYAFATICMAALEGDTVVRDLIATANANSVNLPLLFMTAMSLHPSTFGVQACGTLFLARCLAVFPDFVDKFFVPDKYMAAKGGASNEEEDGGCTKERLFVRLVQLVTAKKVTKSPKALKYAVYILTNLLTTKAELLCKDPLGCTAARRSIRVLSAALKTFAEDTDVLESIMLALLAVVSAAASLAPCVNPVPVAGTMAYHDDNANIQSVGVALLGLLPRSNDPIVKWALKKSAKKFKDDLFIYNTSVDILRSCE